MNYATGFAPPLEEIAAFLRARGVLLYIDGTQSVGALCFDAAKIQPAMLAVHGYKWLLSPNGAGFFYIDPELRARLHPNVVGWRSHRDWRNVDNLHHGAPELPESAEKYEGGSVSFALLYAMEASIDLLLEIGPDAIEQHVMELAGITRRTLRELGAEVQDYASPIVAARFDNCDVSAAGPLARLRARARRSPPRPAARVTALLQQRAGYRDSCAHSARFAQRAGAGSENVTARSWFNRSLKLRSSDESGVCFCS